MTTSLPHTYIARRDLSALTAGIPYVIGFPPQDSLVLFTFARVPALTLGTTMRVDLPEPEHAEAAAEHLVAAATMNRAVAALAVVVGGAMNDHRSLVNALRKGFADNDILLVHASWVPAIRHGERWRCYLDPQCTGEVPDPQTTTWAAAMALAGDPAYRSQEDMAEQLAPDPPESLARREELLDAHLRTPRTPYTEAELESDLTLITHLLTEAEKSPGLPILNDRQLVRLARALSHHEVKDECLAAALTPNPEAAERLWTVLVRALPAPERAEPAVLLAMSAYLRGAGTLAAVALRTALDANPAHTLAQLLSTALTQAAMPPDHLRTMLLKSILKNEGVPDDLLPGVQAHTPQKTDTPHPAQTQPTPQPRTTWMPDHQPPVAAPPNPTTTTADPAVRPNKEPDVLSPVVSQAAVASKPEQPLPQVSARGLSVLPGPGIAEAAPENPSAAAADSPSSTVPSHQEIPPGATTNSSGPTPTSEADPITLAIPPNPGTDEAGPATSPPFHPTVKIRDPGWLATLRKDRASGRTVPGWEPLPKPTESDLNARTAATLGLLTPARTTLNPLTSFLPPQPDSDVRARNAPG